MKVITQLVRHFWQRGAFTAEEVDYLVRHGFARPRDLPGYNGRELAESAKSVAAEPLIFTEPVGPPDPWEEYEARLVRRSSRGRRSVRPRGRVLQVSDLNKRIRGEFQRRDTELDVVVRLANRVVSQCDDWREALIVVRRGGQQQVDCEFSALVQEDDAALKSLWRALDVEPFHQLITDDEVRGRAARAFVALLVARNRSSLGKYGWLLKYDDMQSVINLRVAHRMLLGAISRLYRQEFRLLTRVINASREPVPFWALVLLHNAYRGGLSNVAATREYEIPQRPDDDIWRQAWTESLVMDRRNLTKLLIARYGDGGKQAPGVTARDGLPLHCPVGWRAPSD